MERKDDQQAKIDCLTYTAAAVRRDIIRMIYLAQSGHPGGALSAADILTVLYFSVLKLDPSNPQWPERDRLILSKGHACPAWYACLAERGFFSMSHLETLRKFGSILQGHPDFRKTPGVDMTTGSLGQGLSIGLGMALESRLSDKDFYVYVILGDGELDEGQVWEASLAASKFGLSRLQVIVDRNGLQLDGPTEKVMPLGDIAEKFSAFGFRVLAVDGHDIGEILKALEEGRHESGKPVCIIARTVKGKGVSFMENDPGWHGRPPDKDQYERAMEELSMGKKTI